MGVVFTLENLNPIDHPGCPFGSTAAVLGLVSAIALAHGSILKALAMVVLGLILGLVGTDIYTGTPRFTFGLPEYADGLSFVALAVGVFGIAEILRNLEGVRPNFREKVAFAEREREESNI